MQLSRSSCELSHWKEDTSDYWARTRKGEELRSACVLTWEFFFFTFVCVCVRTPQHLGGGQQTSCRSSFFPPCESQGSNLS